MGDRRFWKEVLSRPRGALTASLVGIGAVVVVLLLVLLVPNLPATAQIGVLVMAAVGVLALIGIVMELGRTEAEARQRQTVVAELAEERHEHEGTREWVQKLLKLQEQTLFYAQEMGGAVQRERLRLDELDSLQRVSLTVLSELSLEAVLSMVSETAATLTQADTASVSLLTDENRMRTHVAAYGVAAGALQGTSSPADTALHGWVIKSGDPLLVNDLDDTGWRQGRAARRDGKQTAIVAPLKLKGRVIGCLSAFDKKFGQLFSEHDLQLLSLFANQAAIAIENARLYERIQRDLEAQTVLFADIQQRVHESLTVVCDLFTAELVGASTSPEPELPGPTHRALQANVRRVQIISQLHDLLARRNYGPLCFGELAESIAGAIQADLDAGDGSRIVLAIDESSALLSPRQALPLALIASEVVNEAASRRAVGQIELSADESDGQITLRIRGHGVGGMLDETSQRAVQMLAQTRLQGQMSLEMKDDTVVTTICFAREAKEPEPETFPGIPLDLAMAPPAFPWEDEG